MAAAVVSCTPKRNPLEDAQITPEQNGGESDPDDASLADAGLELEVASDGAVLRDSAVYGTPLSGFFHDDAPYGSLLVDAVAEWLGSDFELAVAFQHHQVWTDISEAAWQLPMWGKWVAAKPGRKLVLAIAMFPGLQDGSGPDQELGTADDVSLADCAMGKYHEYWVSLADHLVAVGLGDTILRVGPEFDNQEAPWFAHEHELEYAGCFRAVVESMRSAQPYAHFNFNWNATTTIAEATTQQINDAYPGDDVVDSIGVDAYDVSYADDTYPFPTNCDYTCRITRQRNAWLDLTRGIFLMRDFAIAHNKPLSFPEWGLFTTTDGRDGGDNPLFIREISAFFADPANRVSFQCYFDFDAGDGPHEISNVSGNGDDGGVGHTFVTPFPLGQVEFLKQFGGSK